MSKAQELFDQAFNRPRDPRSNAYRCGVLEVLQYRLGERSTMRGKWLYPLGTAESDAYFAGCDEGHRLAREYLEAKGGA